MDKTLKHYIKEAEEKQGTYAGVRLSSKTQQAVDQYCEDNNIPNAIPAKKLHITILYSRKPCPNYTPSQDPYPMTAKVQQFEMWVSEHIEGKPNCLVLKVRCPDLVKRHNELMDEHDATFDYPDYKTHLTFSYDVGDLDVKALPKFEHDIILENEYYEPLRTEYGANDWKE